MLLSDIRSLAMRGCTTRDPQVMQPAVMGMLAVQLDAAKPGFVADSWLPIWQEVGDYARHQARRIEDELEIIVLDAPGGPYDSAHGAARMFEDVAAGRYYVQDFTYSKHPAWDCCTWRAFRTVHDIFGHIASGGDFTPGGEELTFQTHVSHLPYEWWPVIFSETLFQVASAITAGGFPEQHKALVTDLSRGCVHELTDRFPTRWSS